MMTAIRTAFFAMLGASVMLAVPATPAGASLLQDGGWDPGPPIGEPAGIADGSGPELVDDCHISGRTNCPTFDELVQVPPGPFFNTETIARVIRNASMASQATSRGPLATRGPLLGSASLRWDPIGEPGPGCCHNVQAVSTWNGSITIMRVVGAGGYPAMGSHQFGTGTLPNSHLSRFTANGCPPLGIPPVTVENRMAYYLTYMWTRASADVDFGEGFTGGWDEDRVVGGGPMPAPVWQPFPPGVQSFSGATLGGSAFVYFNFFTLFSSRHIFCHNTALTWTNQLGTTSAECTLGSTAMSLNELNPVTDTSLRDYVGGDARFPVEVARNW